MHETRLAQGTVGQLPEPLDGVATVALGAGIQGQGSRQPFEEFPAEVRGERGDLVGLGKVAVEALPELVQPVGGLAVEQV